MAELDDGDFELKDEELVDFEGSDYGFGSDEELELGEEDVALSKAAEEEVRALDLPGKLEKVGVESREGEVTEPAPKATADDLPERQEGAESGEIEEDREEKDEGVVAQPPPRLNSAPHRGFNNEGGRMRESRRRHRKADLEDGELDDAAMVKLILFLSLAPVVPALPLTAPFLLRVQALLLFSRHYLPSLRYNLQQCDFSLPSNRHSL